MRFSFSRYCPWYFRYMACTWLFFYFVQFTGCGCPVLVGAEVLPPQQEHSGQPQPVNWKPASKTPALTRTVKAATTSKPKASTQQNSRPNKNTQGSHNQ
jgi:hypothetical protein